MSDMLSHLTIGDTTAAEGATVNVIVNNNFGDAISNPYLQGQAARAIKDWLRPPDYHKQLKKLNLLRKKRARNTGQWLLDDIFPAWLHPSQHLVPHPDIDAPKALSVRSVTVVMDAIDELPSVDFRNEVLGLVEELHNFGQKCNRLALRVSLCGRWHDDLHSVCEPAVGWVVKHMPPLEIELDIKTFILERINKNRNMRRQPEHSKKGLCEMITRSAQGMFRLAALYMDELMSWDCSELPDVYLKTLLRTDNLPRDLDSFYDLIVSRVQPLEMRADMFVILKWILVAARPMSVGELVDACATLPSEGGLFSEDKRDACRRFTRHLAGLVNVSNLTDSRTVPLGASYMETPQVEEQASVVSFAHFSVKEYVLRMMPLGWIPVGGRMDLKLVQSYATRCCLAYLVYCNSHAGGRSSRYAFRAYAWQHWATHAAKCSEARLDDSGGCDGGLSPAYFETRASPFSLRLFNTVFCPLLYVVSPPSDGRTVDKLLAITNTVLGLHVVDRDMLMQLSTLNLWFWVFVSAVLACCSLPSNRQVVNEYHMVLLESCGTESWAAFEERYADILRNPEFLLDVTQPQQRRALRQSWEADTMIAQPQVLEVVVSEFPRQTALPLAVLLLLAPQR
ncbi:hypothetical protein LTR85_011934 [Meristemomyces frigidus]|nr:hypothetical protein LTR85_011934 [Meristemomyces frigidus]